MFLKKILLCGFVICASLGIAQHGSFVEGTHGHGLVRDAAGHSGKFRYEVVRYRTPNNELHLRGSWTFTNIAAQPADRFEIKMIRPNELAVDGHAAAFEGHAVLVRMTPSGIVRREGLLGCHVQDRKRPNNPGDPDTFGFRFVPAHGGPVIELEGLVVEGDLVVKDQQSDK